MHQCKYDNVTLQDPLAQRAYEILLQAAQNIKERDKDYNSDTIKYKDYQLHGIDSIWENILECFVRLFNSGSDDKAADWAAYAALQAAFIEHGAPQSRFSPAFALLQTKNVNN